MAAAVAREEHHVALAELAAEERVGGTAERRVKLDLLDGAQPLHLVEAASADHTQHRLAHCAPRSFSPLAARRTTGRRRLRYPVLGSRGL